VDPEFVGGLGQAPVCLAKHARDEALFEFVHGILVPHAACDHFFDELL
jgi:hypothetical protein